MGFPFVDGIFASPRLRVRAERGEGHAINVLHSSDQPIKHLYPMPAVDELEVHRQGVDTGRAVLKGILEVLPPDCLDVRRRREACVPTRDDFERWIIVQLSGDRQLDNACGGAENIWPVAGDDIMLAKIIDLEVIDSDPC